VEAQPSRRPSRRWSVEASCPKRPFSGTGESGGSSGRSFSQAKNLISAFEEPAAATFTDQVLSRAVKGRRARRSRMATNASRIDRQMPPGRKEPSAAWAVFRQGLCSESPNRRGQTEPASEGGLGLDSQADSHSVGHWQPFANVNFFDLARTALDLGGHQKRGLQKRRPAKASRASPYMYGRLHWSGHRTVGQGSLGALCVVRRVVIRPKIDSILDEQGGWDRKF
jgi:hypothetical protein